MINKMKHIIFKNPHKLVHLNQDETDRKHQNLLKKANCDLTVK